MCCVFWLKNNFYVLFSHEMCWITHTKKHVIRKNHIFYRSRPAFGCQPELESNTFLQVDPSSIACFRLFLCSFPFFFSLFCSVSEGRSCFSIIFFYFYQQTACRAPFAGQNKLYWCFICCLWSHRQQDENRQSIVQLWRESIFGGIINKQRMPFTFFLLYHL